MSNCVHLYVFIGIVTFNIAVHELIFVKPKNIFKDFRFLSALIKRKAIHED